MAGTPLLLAATCVLFFLYAVRRHRRNSKLPPGPPRLPLIGNILQAPKSSPWIQFQKWAQEYGPLVSVDFGGNIIILISDYGIARDLLDKRAATYSARPSMIMVSELMCKDQYVLLRQPGPRYVMLQRLHAPVVNARASSSYEPIQDMESKVLLHNLLGSSDIKKYFAIYSASIAYLLMYGFRIMTNEEWQIRAGHELVGEFVHAAQPGSFLVDSIPLMRFLPTFIAPFKKHAAAYYQKATNLHIRNFNQGLDSKSWNWAKSFAASDEAAQMSEEELAWGLGALQDAAIETTDVFLQLFVLACVDQPGFMGTAQKEIDEVVGFDGSRMPEFADLNNLPYVHAIVEEVFRWRHILPAGFAHASSEDDWYNGYLIPKGSTIVPLFKAMREDENLYENPMEFRPERWLGTKGQPNNWGYGKRACTGRHIAKNSITIAVARILWAFHVRSADRKQVVVDENMFTEGLASYPKAFGVVFEPRTGVHKTVIEASYEKVDKNPESIMAGVWDAQVKRGLKPTST